MARTKNVKVINIKSSVKDKKPAVGDIDYGEIAVNYNSGSTFLAVKDSKNEIKVFTDKTTNDANYAPKTEFDTLSSTVNEVSDGLTELKNKVIDNEETTSAALNDLNSKVNQLSSVDMGDYATTATTEGIKSDISGLQSSVQSNESKISALEGKSHILYKAADCTTYTDDTGGLTPAAVKKAFDGQLTAAKAANANRAEWTTRLAFSSITRGSTIGEFQTNLKNFVIDTVNNKSRDYRIINISADLNTFVTAWNNNNTGATITDGGNLSFVPIVAPTISTNPYCAWIVSTYSDGKQYLLVLSYGKFSPLRRISTDIDLDSYVPTSRTINGTALTQNITIKKVDLATTSTNVNGYTVAKSVPSDAKFTDTTYDDVTTSTHGLMTAADKTKLNGIASGATKYSHPTFTAKTSGFYKVAVNNEGHVTGTTNVAASDITGLIGTPSLTGHNHDDRYYTESEINTKLNAKSNIGHTHTKSEITDLADWVKANSKPSYNFNEIGGTVDVTKQLNGTIPSANLPSYVDDVLEYNKKTNFPTTGETGKIYVDTSTNLTYRWGGNSYVEISPSLALGETSGTAYRGDYGKIAYTHSQLTSGNPHNVTKSDVGLGNVDNKSSETIRGEITKSNVITALGFTPVSTTDVEKNEEDISALSSSTVNIQYRVITAATMSSTATEPSVSNNTLTIPTVAGAKGDKGADGTNGTDGISASITGATATATTLAAGSDATAKVEATGSNTSRGFNFKFGIPKGEKGDKGADGTSASITGVSATTTTLAAGSDATAKVEATGSNTSRGFNFKFGIPKGEKGDKGDKGVDGTNGTDGISASITGVSATATTLAAGSNATAKVEATGSNTSRGFSFTFGIPKGEKGDKGDKGDVGPSANATTSNGKRYLLGLSTTTGNITGATTSGSCYMSGGYLYSHNEKVALSSEIPTTYAGSLSSGGPADSALGVRDYGNTGSTIKIGYAGNSLEASEISYIAAYKNGTSIKDASASAVISFLSAVTKSDLSDYVTSTELNNKGYLTSIAWTGITGKPSTFTPATHTHSQYVNKSGDTINGTLFIDNGGGVTLSANGQTYLNNVLIKDGLSISGTTTMADDLTVTGKVSASNGFFQTSDKRLKNFQGDIEVDFDKLKSIPKKYFYWNLDSRKSKLEIGTSAQEVMEVYPELVSMNESGMLSVAYDKLSVIALKAVDELHEENKTLKEKNEELERRLKAIEEKLGI